MRCLLNIFIAIMVALSGVASFAAPVTETPSIASVPEQKTQDDAKTNEQKREVPPPKPKETKKNPEVPPRNKDKAETPTENKDAKDNKPDEKPAGQGNVEKVNVEVSTHYDGIDVSRHQQTIDWEEVARDKNIKYAYIKATEGQSFVDPKFRENLENAHKAGIKVGCYHFLRTGSLIRDQFNNFTRNVKKNEQDLIPLLDVEVSRGWSNQQLRDSVKLFVDLLEEHYGCKPMIYTSSSFFNNILGRLFADYPLFIARYAASEPTLSNGAKWVMWQYSDRGRVRGIAHNVDMSRFNKGCGLRDILIKDNKITHHKRRNSEVVDKNQEKPAAVSVKPAPVMSQQQEKELKKQQEKEQKARERAEKLAREDAEKAEKEARKKAEKEARERANELRKAQEKAEKEARERKKAEQKAREKAEKEAKEKAKAEQKAREKAEKEAQEKAEKEAREKAKAEQKAREQAVKDALEKGKENAAQEAQPDEAAAAQAAIAAERAKVQERAKAELEQEAKEEAARKARQAKKQDQKEKMQRLKAASSAAVNQKDSTNTTTPTSTAKPTRKRTNKSTADND